MKEIRLMINTKMDVKNIKSMIAELKALNIFNEEKGLIIYDENDQCIEKKIVDILDKYCKSYY